MDVNNQVLDVLNLGIIILDSQYKVLFWNRWMEIHSGKNKQDIEGTMLFNHYPQLSTLSFTRGCKSVLKFGNYVYFSQKLHNYLFPFNAGGVYCHSFEYMQQSCTMTPVRDKDGKPENIVLSVQDVSESVYLEKNLKMMAWKDSLTGLYNRRFLDSRMEDEYQRFVRSANIFCFLMIDIDNFKRVNDSFGHQFGDKVLKEIALCCSSTVRSSDIVARYGGEEFAIALMDSNETGALSFAERLRKKIEETIITNEESADIHVTVSIGVSTSNGSFSNYEEIIGGADKALYASKRNGKN
jgi:diguanylate cyclase